MLADFGEADHCVLQEQTTVGSISPFSQHVRDVQKLAMALADLLDMAAVTEGIADDSVLLEWIEHIAALQPDKAKKDDVLGVLGAFLVTADEERRKIYRPMPEEAKTALEATKVSDSELKLMFCRPESRR